MNTQEAKQKDAPSDEAASFLYSLIEQQGLYPVNNLDEISDLWPVNDDPDLLLEHILTNRADRRRLSTEKEQRG